MGIKIVSFLKIKSGLTAGIIEALRKIPEVVKIQTITGEYDLLLEITASESEEIAMVFAKQIDLIPGIREIHSHFVMKTWEK